MVSIVFIGSKQKTTNKVCKKSNNFYICYFNLTGEENQLTYISKNYKIKLNK